MKLNKNHKIIIGIVLIVITLSFVNYFQPFVLTPITFDEGTVTNQEYTCDASADYCNVKGSIDCDTQTGGNYVKFRTESLDYHPDAWGGWIAFNTACDGSDLDRYEDVSSGIYTGGTCEGHFGSIIIPNLPGNLFGNDCSGPLNLHYDGISYVVCCVGNYDPLSFKDYEETPSGTESSTSIDPSREVACGTVNFRTESLFYSTGSSIGYTSTCGNILTSYKNLYSNVFLGGTCSEYYDADWDLMRSDVPTTEGRVGKLYKKIGEERFRICIDYGSSFWVTGPFTPGGSIDTSYTSIDPSLEVACSGGNTYSCSAQLMVGTTNVEDILYSGSTPGSAFSAWHEIPPNQYAQTIGGDTSYVEYKAIQVVDICVEDDLICQGDAVYKCISEEYVFQENCDYGCFAGSCDIPTCNQDSDCGADTCLKDYECVNNECTESDLTIPQSPCVGATFNNVSCTWDSTTCDTESIQDAEPVFKKSSARTVTESIPIPKKPSNIIIPIILIIAISLLSVILRKVKKK